MPGRERTRALRGSGTEQSVATEYVELARHRRYDVVGPVGGRRARLRTRAICPGLRGRFIRVQVAEPHCRRCGPLEAESRKFEKGRAEILFESASA